MGTCKNCNKKEMIYSFNAALKKIIFWKKLSWPAKLSQAQYCGLYFFELMHCKLSLLLCIWVFKLCKKEIW